MRFFLRLAMIAGCLTVLLMYAALHLHGGFATILGVASIVCGFLTVSGIFLTAIGALQVWLIRRGTLQPSDPANDQYWLGYNDGRDDRY